MESLKTELEAGLGRLNGLLSPDTEGDTEQQGSLAAAQIADSSTISTSPRAISAGVHTLVVRFDTDLGKMDSDQAAGSKGTKKLKRYQMNPTKDWGPLSKARG